MSLMAWYPLNGNTNNYGAGSLELTQAAAPTYASGKLGSKALATGSFTWTAEQTASVFNSEAYTYACWFMATPTTASSDRTMIFGNDDSNKYRQFSLFQYPTANDFHFSWDLNGIDNTNVALGLVKGAFPSNTWVHLAITYKKGETVKVYLNGTLAFETSYTVTLTASVSDYARETTVIYNSEYHRICDLRIYDHCLSPKEVHELAKGLCLHYPMNTINGMGSLPNIALTHSMREGPTDSYNNTSVTSSYTIVADAATESGWAMKEEVTNSGTSDSLLGGYYFKYPKILGTLDKLTSGNTYTGSFKMRASRPVTMHGGALFADQTYVSSTPTVGSTVSVGTEYQTYTITFKFTTTSKFTSCFYAYPEASSSVTVWIADYKLEEGSVPTGYIQHADDPQYMQISSDVIPDESGMGHDAMAGGTPSLATGSPRYRLATGFTSSDYLYNIPDPLSSAATEFSFSMWVNTSATGNQCLWNGRSTVGSSVAVFLIGSKVRFDVNSSASSPYQFFSSTTLSTNTWYHIACTLDSAGKRTIYINGAPDSSSTTTVSMSKSNNYASIGRSSNADESPSGNQFTGYMSDYRIYATCLSADDVKALYSTSASMDSAGNLHTGEIVEQPGRSKPSLTRTGSALVHGFSELAGKYDTGIYVEPDGSMWVRAFHHSSPTDNLFSSSDPFTTSVYGNDTRWFNMSICDHMDKWEIIYEQQATPASDVHRFRWVQKVNPMAAEYADVAAANITKYTSSDGYTNLGSSYGGLYAKNSNAYLCCNNGTSGNWWGSVGVYVDWQSCTVPGYNQVSVTTGYVDVYVRVDNVSFSGYKKSGFSMGKSDGSISATGLYEA